MILTYKLIILVLWRLDKMKKIDFELLFNSLLDDTIEINGLQETVARLIETDLDDEQLLYLGFEQDSIDSGKDLVKEWESFNA